jgi:hypothetical protein
MKMYRVKYLTTGGLVRTVFIHARDADEAALLITEENGDVEEIYSVKES